MAYGARELVNIAISHAVTADGARTSAFRGGVAAMLSLTHWADKPLTEKSAREAVRDAFLDAGESKVTWESYAKDVCDFARKVVAKMPEAPTVIAVKDASTAEAAMDAMLVLFKSLEVLRPFHVRLWAQKLEATALTDEDRADKVKEKKPAASKAGLLDMVVGGQEAAPEISGSAPATLELPGDKIVAAILALSNEEALAAILVAANARLMELRTISATVPDAAMPLDTDTKRSARKPRNAAKGLEALAALAA